MTATASILLADTVAKLSAAHAGCVLVNASHGGRIAAHYVAHARVRAAISKDAGVGCNEAGIAGVAWLESRGIAAAAVAHVSARIADAAEGLKGTFGQATNRPSRTAVSPFRGRRVGITSTQLS